MKHVFTDVDGSKYYTNFRNDIIDSNGNLVSLVAESNVRNILAQRAKRNQARRGRDDAMRSLGLTKVRGNLGGAYWE